METTRRRLASARRCLASKSPCSTKIASSCSSSLLRRGTTPISFRYMRTGSLTLAELLPRSSSSVSSASSSSLFKTRALGFPSLSVIEMPASWMRCSKSSIPSASKVKGMTSWSLISSSVATPVCLWLRINSAI